VGALLDQQQHGRAVPAGDRRFQRQRRRRVLGDDSDEGRPIKVVFRWTRLGPDAARWQQAFSLDGKEWETNWIIEHRRVKEKRS